MREMWITEKQDKTTLGEKAASSLRSTVMSREPPLKPTVEKQATPVMSREPPLKPTVEKQATPVMSREPPLKPTVEKQATPVMSREPPLKPTVEKQATPVMSREPPLKPTVEKQATPVMSLEPPLKPTVEKQATPVNVPKPTTKKVAKEKLRPQTQKKPLRIEDFILYPKWDIEEDYHRDPSAKKTTCPESIRSRSAEIDWFKQLFIPDISLFMHKEHFNDEEWKRLEHFNPPYGWMGTNYTEVKQAVELIPGLKEQTVLLSPKRNDGCIRCAAVGNGGILNGSRKGAEIDSHDYIFRVNGAVIKGFEDDVGVRTSFYVHTAQTMLSSLWGYQELGFTNVPMDKEIKYIMVTEGMRDYQWLRALLLNTTVSRGPYLKMRPRSYFGTDFTPEKYLVAHPDFNRYIKNRFLKSKTVEGIDWAIYRPTTGAFALLLALHLCDVVDAYGYITEDYAKYPNHYYDKTKTETEFYDNHDFGLEIKEWKKLHDSKLMNLYQGR
ncbi:alpha-N-acetylgalactosaminide alpha-2,6-sialyltransferase 1-like isoform X3 [Acipenser ruthenus]|uniref:alpha-N-acetylgalactosaminide alpha-2,6-sialyltransferase 1-like isoform X3 n=1 Tax=Acipenser ruthenus TaxID=7906 RepID=UPI00145BBA46|nr:alpha-N-acetylgalactosaminide alpha-2,6-sialyltransferase 1-like isoform X3 [Acipenser ruthenus]